MLDRIFAAVSMLGVIAFMSVLTFFVNEPDLWIVTILIVGIGILFFVQEFRAGGSHFVTNRRRDEPEP